MSSTLFKNFIKKAILSKQGAPGPPPREGLQWKPQTRRWIRPDPYAGMKSWERSDARNRDRYNVKVQEAKDSGIEVSTRRVKPTGDDITSLRQSRYEPSLNIPLKTFSNFEEALTANYEGFTKEMGFDPRERYARALMTDSGDGANDRTEVIRRVYEDTVKGLGSVAVLNLIDPTREELGLRSGQVGLSGVSDVEALAIHFGQNPDDKQAMSKLESKLHSFAKKSAEQIVRKVESSPYPLTPKGQDQWRESVRVNIPFEQSVKNTFLDMAGDAEANGEMEGMTKNQKRDYLVDQVYINTLLPELEDEPETGEDFDRLNDAINEAIDEYVS